MKNLEKKQVYRCGNSIIGYSLVVFLVIIILFCISMLYIQLYFNLVAVKTNLPSIVQNVALLNCDKEALRNFSYEFDMENLKKDLNFTLKSNYNNVDLKIICYDDSSNIFNVELEVKLEPILNIKGINNITVRITDKIKFKNMEVLNKKEN